MDCGCQNSQGKTCVNKNANISSAVRDICLTITHHPPQSFVIEIFYWPITSAICRQCETGGRAPAQVSGSCRPHGVVLNVRGLRRPSIRARRSLPSSLTPFSGCTEHFVSRNLQGILPHQHSKTAVQSIMNVPPLPFTQETGAGAREDSSPWGQPFTSASLPTSNTAACPANKVYTA